ncbi:MAG: WD40 repeat domain-containing protein [Proteobacteria bacterium]|nr:WD40 repeat domain-containing protein [Pseudomonadota bacterium]
MDALELEETRQKLYNRLPLVGARQRQQAAEALAAAAMAGHPQPARVLAEALASHFDDKIKQMAFNALRELQQTRTVNAVCAVWESTRSADLAALIKDCRWVATTPFELRVATALLARRTSIFEDDDPQMAVALLEACTSTDTLVAREAARAVTLISDAGMRETICELVTYREFTAPAIDAVVNGGYAPSEKPTRALFFLLTGQTQQLQTLPDAPTHLWRAYDEADLKLKSRALSGLRQAARAEWIPWLFSDERLKLSVVNRLEWETAFEVLRLSNALELLWKMSKVCPPEMSAEILELLHDRDYMPSSLEETGVMRDLYRLRPQPASHGRLYLDEPQNQATLTTGLPILRDGRGTAHSSSYRTIAFAADGRRVVTAGEELALWETYTGQQICAMNIDADTPCASVRLIAASYDGVMLATCEDHTVHARPVSRIWLWALGDSQPVTLLEEDRLVSDLQFSPDGHTLAVAGIESTRIWDVREWKKTLIGELPGAVSCVRWWPRTRLLAAASPGGNVQLWDPGDGKVRRVMQGKAPAVYDMRFAPDGRHVITLHEDASGRLWSVQDAACLSVLRHESGLRAIDFSPDGTLMATGTGDGSLRLWQVDPFKLFVTLQKAGSAAPCGIRSIAFSADGRRLASTTQGQRHVAVWSLTNNQLVAECSAIWPQGMALPPGDLGEPGELQFSRSSDALAARFGSIVQVWMLTHPQPFGAMSAGDLRMADEMAGRMADNIDARAWRFAAAVLRARFSSMPADA